jgi:hypothetical protein
MTHVVVVVTDAGGCVGLHEVQRVLEDIESADGIVATVLIQRHGRAG